ncbi:MAG: hypothetical protein H0X03_08425 [Nitrosopumilus sp.]|nr:hypothetical protein [Nitrosopumilus sp.]
MRIQSKLMITRNIILGIIITTLSLTSIVSTTPLILHQASNAAAWTDPNPQPRKAPPSITGTNVYVAWWTNNTATANNKNNEDVMFRASTDGGITFGDKINLSNTTNSDSWKAEIDSDADSVVVIWWETNQTSDVPVMRVSNDNGETFGPVLNLASNGTITSSSSSSSSSNSGAE